MENYFIKLQSMAVKFNFTMKVMSYVALAFAITTLGYYLAPHILSLNFVLNGGPLTIFIVEIGLFSTASKWSQLARPTNILIYLLFGFLFGLIIHPLLIISGIDIDIDIIAKVLIATVCLSLAAIIYAKTTQRDLSGMEEFLNMGLYGLFIFGILQIFWPSPTVQVYISGWGIILFSSAIVYDVQQTAKSPENRVIEVGLSIYIYQFSLYLLLCWLFRNLMS